MHDFVLIAAPPMTQEGATLAIAALCDGALLVLRPGWTTDESARRAERSLGDVGVALLGAVFTAVPPRPGRVGSPLHRVWAGASRSSRDYGASPRRPNVTPRPRRRAMSATAAARAHAVTTPASDPPRRRTDQRAHSRPGTEM